MSVIHLLVLSLLITLVARLWYLQVLSGTEARALAEQTSVRLIYKDAPRGFIFDRNGEALARNRTALTVAMDVSRLPTQGRDEILFNLARKLDVDVDDVRAAVEDPRLGFYEPRPIAIDVPKDVVIELLEHQESYPGVTALEIPVREYPYNQLGAHVLGHIGQVSDAELSEAEEGVYRPGENIGKIGVEKLYEQWLRGTDGIQKIAVDVHGKKVQNLASEQPERGSDAVLTIDAALQQAAEDALERGVILARRLTDPDTGKLYEAPAGAVVALDPRNGEVLAMASYPTFDPNMFARTTSSAELAELNDPEAHFPMLNRTIAEAVPPGSTFKPITAAAAWEAAMVSPNRTFECPGHLDIGNRRFKDWDPKGHGTVGLRTSLVESCDVVYYTLGIEMNEKRQVIGEHLQEMTRKFHFGTKLGIDLLGERDGLVPTADWKYEQFSWANPVDRKWFAGDSANLAIGQGFLQVTPLQLATAYGAIANGGTLYRPHVMKCLAELDVSQPTSAQDACSSKSAEVPEPASPQVLGRVPVSPGALEFIADAMSGVGMGDGTAAETFSGFPFDRVSVSGKTGTAQMKPRQPFSWFAAFAPVEDPQIVIVALVEEGGTGAQIAAPIVRRVIERHFGLPEGDLEAGARAD